MMEELRDTMKRSSYEHRGKNIIAESEKIISINHRKKFPKHSEKDINQVQEAHRTPEREDQKRKFSTANYS